MKKHQCLTISPQQLFSCSFTHPASPASQISTLSSPLVTWAQSSVLVIVCACRINFSKEKYSSSLVFSGEVGKVLSLLFLFHLRKINKSAAGHWACRQSWWRMLMFPKSCGSSLDNKFHKASKTLNEMMSKMN